MTTSPFKNIVSITEPTIPQAMIDGIRRRLGSVNGDAWDASLEFSQEVPETAEPHSDTSVFMAAPRVVGEYSPTDGSTDYYKSLVSAAIKNGGKHGDHRMPIPWLRMIQAGLEFRRVDPEMMWYGVEAGDTRIESLAEVPPYESLFPSDPLRFSGPGLD